MYCTNSEHSVVIHDEDGLYCKTCGLPVREEEFEEDLPNKD